MSILKKSYAYFKQILDKENTFTKILNRSINNDETNENEIKIIKDTLKSTVNKYYFLRYEVQTATKDIKLCEEEINILVVCLSMRHYVKLSLEQILAFYIQDEESFKSIIENYTLNLELVTKVLDEIGEKPMLVDDKFENIAYKKLALRFSYPDWVVKMHLKHFGYKNTIKSLSSCRHNVPLVINYNPLLITPSELNEIDFKKCSLASSSYAYVSKEKIIDNQLFKEKKIFVEDEATQFISDILDPHQGEEILLIEDSKGLLPLDVSLKTANYASISIACSNIESLNAVKKISKFFDLKSVQAFETDMKLLITHVEDNHFDKVAIIPPSSSLGLIRKKPDVLLTLNRNELDNIISNEKYALKEASTFVKVGGNLLYCVFTMNKKEGENLIKEFLNENTNFELLENRQVFPYESMNDGFYYALLKRSN